jgi:deoxyribodipyrimidine photo-lyase
MTGTLFTASRAHALGRVAAFVPRAGNAYASGRNTDNGRDRDSNVSLLSPYVRYRLITEKEIVQSVLSRHKMQAAEKFVQEVLWRTYWKGWLEMRPMVWTQYLAERDHARATFPNARAITSAENGMTGIDGFDDWARELVETGYLHNHARMWFASIWIFTLRLPWALGADFFLRHLIDGDAASNTLSWRWVAGLQTAGKTYLATADNISRYTNGRYSPKGLAQHAAPLTEQVNIAAGALPGSPHMDENAASILLVTHEDMHPESFIPAAPNITSALVIADTALHFGDAAAEFASAASADTRDRIQQFYKCSTQIAPSLDSDAIITAAQAAGVTQIITPYAPVGLVASALADLTAVLAKQGIALVQVRRSWDARFWPHAKKGFFPFKEKIAAELRNEGILAQA